MVSDDPRQFDPLDDVLAGQRYVRTFAINPDDGAPRLVYVPKARLRAIALRGPGHRLEAARTVPRVLSIPGAIFRGVRHESEREWLCYSGVPPNAFDGPTGEEIRAPAGMVFLVFVTDRRVVYNWRWEWADSRRPESPIDWEERFDERAL